MKLAWILAALTLVATGTMWAACQAPEPTFPLAPPPTATAVTASNPPAAVAAPEPTPTATTSATVVATGAVPPTEVLSVTEAPPATQATTEPTITPGSPPRAIIVPLTPPGPQPGATQRSVNPTPTPAYPSLDDVPVTDGPALAPIMSSRQHFPTQLRISDVVPNGYNTVPPTSGQHWAAWSDCGFYNYPLPDELLVHNLEHGNIIVSYNLDDASEIAALRAAMDAIPLAAEFAITRRYEQIPEGMVALTAWGVLDRMIGVDAERIAYFFRSFPGNTGPEFPNGLPCTTGVRINESSGS